jgi:DnaJ like chaperone protein
MRWGGKVVGALIGFATGLGPVGAIVGLVIGHAYDERMGSEVDDAPAADAHAVSATFFRSAFEVMGCVAKADGRVSEQEIAAARQIFRQFRLDEAKTREAIDCFNRGKQPDFSLDAALAGLRRACGDRHDLLRVFLEVQMRAALLGSGMQGPTRAVLGRIAQALGVSGLEFAHLEAVLRLQGYGGYAYAGSAGSAGGAGYGADPGGAPGARPRPDLLREAYEVLEVSPDASDADVKRAYRRQMSQNHPDKLVARGLPESMLEMAKQKTQAIQAAWERVREARGLR